MRSHTHTGVEKGKKKKDYQVWKKYIRPLYELACVYHYGYTCFY